ncbi:WAT1-related protein At5g47470 [Cornus florida]|uniref:WAT1-related protein At5g47470 n=1 Tax=Cornus florida TaxID=4283 RepID=UPI00289F7544|nr:WAT1-related protein At5g47470 [Cornus florida]
METPKREVIEDFTIIGGLIVVQMIYAGNSLLLSYLMSLGLNSFTLIIFSAFSTFLVLSPLCIRFERTKWPKKFSLKLLIQLLLISFGGITLFQSFFLQGIKLTSPAVATAMPNLAPGLIFVIAWVFRLEKVKLSCMYSQIKIVGTLLCVIGAITMSLMHSTIDTPTEKEVQLLTLLTDDSKFDKQKIIGCVYLMAAVFVLSSNIVLQATALVDFPAPVSMCAITSLIGAITTAVLQLIQEHKLETGWPAMSFGHLIGYSLLGGTINGACVSFNGWAIKKRGPVLVSMFGPVATVISVILSVITMGDSITLGSLAGMLLMFTGLYFVLWAKGRESLSIKDGDTLKSEYDTETPLLS